MPHLRHIHILHNTERTTLDNSNCPHIDSNFPHLTFSNNLRLLFTLNSTTPINGFINQHACPIFPGLKSHATTCIYASSSYHVYRSHSALTYHDQRWSTIYSNTDVPFTRSSCQIQTFDSTFTELRKRVRHSRTYRPSARLHSSNPSNRRNSACSSLGRAAIKSRISASPSLQSPLDIRRDSSVEAGHKRGRECRSHIIIID
jgi:hypothetical protein